MVKKKIKSKRMTVAKRHMIEKKVREHNRKMRRAAKKDPSLRPKLKKDPGVPNLLPWKSQLLDEIEQKKAEEQLAKQQRRLSQKEQLEEMRRRAEAEGENFGMQEESESDEYVDNSRKAFFKEFMKVVKASDVVLEVIDARDPLGTRCQEVEQQILKLDPNKKIVLVMNKIDLVPKANMMQWLQYLRAELPTVAFKATTSKRRPKLGLKTSVPIQLADPSSTSGCIGASTLMSLLKNYTRTPGGGKKNITVGIIGYPNVGKSSLINSLKRERAVGVGAMPGFTRNAQQVQLDKHITLYDSPGIIFASNSSEAEAVLHNSVKLQDVTDVIAPVELILQRTPREQLQQLYNIPAFSKTQEFLAHVAERRGRYKQGGVLDLEGAARVVLQDWTNGKIPYISIPPVRQVHLSAEIVPEWSKEFDLREVEKLEAEVLANLEDCDESKFATLPEYRPKPDEMFALMNAPHLLNQQEEEESGESEEDEEDEEDEENVAMADADNSEEPAASGEMEDDAQAAAPAQSTAPSRRQKLGDEQDMYNPQINQQRKQALKKQKKKQKKRKRDESDTMTQDDLARLAAESDDADGGDDFNFDVDFWMNVKPTQVVNTSIGGSVSPANANKLQKTRDMVDSASAMDDYNV